MNPAWIAAICAILTVFFAAAGWLSRSSWRFVKKIWQFLEDWNGLPADTRGHSGTPGVMQRLITLESQVHMNIESLDDIRKQVNLNSGQSLKDVVARTESAVGRLQISVNELRTPPGT